MHGLIAACLLLLALSGGAATPRAERVAGDLVLEVVTDRVAYPLGDPVGITLRVTSTASAPVVVTIGGQPYDVFVRQRGALVWQWSHDKAFAQVVRETPLAPGQALKYQAVWDQRDLQGRRVEAGRYDISAVFLGAQRSGPQSIEAGPVRITIGR